MIQKTFRRLVIGSWTVVLGLLLSTVGAEGTDFLNSPTISTPKRIAGGFEIRVRGLSAVPLMVQASNDLVEWHDHQQVTLSGGEVVVTDILGGGSAQRYYRLKPLAVTLPDLNGLKNSVFPAGEGFNTMQYAASGTLGFIVWRDQQLVLRERTREGVWSETVISNDGRKWVAKDYEDFRFQSAAALLFDSGSRAHVLRVTSSGSAVVHHARDGNGSWRTEQFGLPSGSPALFAAAMGPGDRIHVTVASSGSPSVITHLAQQNGQWTSSRVTQLAGSARGFLTQSYSPRFFSLAVDSKNFAHISFTPEFRMGQGPGGYGMPSSELAYASNRSGQWRTERVYAPQDSVADAGLGACVAIGPDDQPAMASFYNERAATGSAQWGQLLYHLRGTDGVWRSSVVTKNPDGYSAGDGPRGAGFAPHLLFDGQGRPHIAFSDHASEHFSSGQNEFCGQIRHASYDGRQWNFQTVYRQSAPVQNQMVYPTLALSASGEPVFLGLQRQSTWRSEYRVANSTYNFIFVPGRLR